MSVTLQRLNDELAHLVKSVGQSLVTVTDGARGGAAGTIWHPQGLVVTNAHVVTGRHARVTLADGRTLEAKVLASDSDKDLAALSVDAEDLPTIKLGNSRDLHAGQFVMALGHPWGVKCVATAGIIMGTGAENLRISFAQNLLPVNLSLRPGNSGGPLVDVEGRLLGINTMMTGPDSGLAIPVDLAKDFLKSTLGSRVY